MKLTFWGAARTVTGSMHFVEAGGKKILLDCGLFQGHREEANRRNRNFPFDPASIDAVVLSHAHIDHSGNLPHLVKSGYRGPIFATEATKDLCGVMLADSGHLQEKDAEYYNEKRRQPHEPPIEPLYTARDAAVAMEQFRGMPYGKEFDVVPGVTAVYSDAGHILGSAGIRLTVRQNGTVKTLGFTGDIGRWDMPIVRDPQYPGDVEALITESTYGGKKHDPPDEMGGLLAADLLATINRGGKVIVPAFSVGRTQDLVFELHKLFDAGKLPKVPIFVDSPLAVNATEIFRRHPECFDEETSRHIAQHHDPFGLSQLAYVRSAEESKKLNDRTDPCMIIAASGMCEAGRILHHLANTVQDEKNTILIVGYCAEGTLGKRLVDQANEVRIFGQFYQRRASVIVRNSFSAHADGDELLKYLGKFDRNRLGKIFVVHGEEERSEALKAGLSSLGFPSVDIPQRGQQADL
jgi:metallo-beta-lactamase family protein